jgi:hypothetical protein
MRGLDPLVGRINYFMGKRKSPGLWITEVPTFSGVVYEGIYPAVDLNIGVRQGKPEYVFSIDVGAGPSVITLAFPYADSVRIANDGDLVVQRSWSTARLARPFAYQVTEAGRSEIRCAFKPLGQDRIGFTFGAFDHSRPLVIDPVLEYASYLGGSRDD